LNGGKSTLHAHESLLYMLQELVVVRGQNGWLGLMKTTVAIEIEWMDDPLHERAYVTVLHW
jgi:hypothetical protein